MINNKLLKVGLYNAGSLGTGHDNFIAAMEKYSADIMAINETWIREGEIGRAPSVPNYRLRYVPRPSNICHGRGGGVGFYIKRGVNVRTCPHPINPIVDQMWLKLSVKSSKLIIGTAYRPQWVSVNDFLEALMDSIATFSYCDNIIILGDFNIDMLSGDDAKTKLFEGFLVSTELNQVIDVPTHFTDHSQTLIDVVCTNVRSRNIYVELVGSDIGHAFITCEFIFKKPKISPKTIVYRPIKDICLDLFTNDLESIRWDLICSADHVDCMVSDFSGAITLLFDLHAPIKSRIIKELPSPWLTDNVKLMMRRGNGYGHGSS
ncbi:putative reverse transcriptase [Operophtera brumata]|uniref:Putative reverse transcriptase n=1 Tax=Operophtera brumata TaxID=104452 RepID=A0A0L7LML6_OPEBR|nr:putative reverse transcriptase [Operophtera brumata]